MTPTLLTAGVTSLCSSHPLIPPEPPNVTHFDLFLPQRSFLLPQTRVETVLTRHESHMMMQNDVLHSADSVNLHCSPSTPCNTFRPTKTDFSRVSRNTGPLRLGWTSSSCLSVPEGEKDPTPVRNMQSPGHMNI